MDNAQIKLEADLLLQECHMAELLAAYPAWFIGGSYSYDLMCWRDLDIYVFDPQHDLKCCFEVGYELTRRLRAKKSSFTNMVGSEPNGLYWGIKLGDPRQGAWKLDVWFLAPVSYDQHASYSAGMRARLTAETRSIILLIKEAYWRRQEYRDTVTSDLIYRAVLDHDVRDVSGFEHFLSH
jgi:hypothetical protein